MTRQGNRFQAQLLQQTPESPEEQTSSVEELSGPFRVSDQSSTPLARSQNLSLWSHFGISSLPGVFWYPKRGKKGPIEDRVDDDRFCLSDVHE
ncbi:hypothetical protein V1525DRAFT_385353 [Lipomyces kononenkoae]|uniref:Uncharacterized protein n=1 Tax=Lipomyces kononenkoae TaxID=34357 RepID=A0ACC3T9S9_LIPKO